MRAELQVKNYRCFSDEAPLVLPLGDAPVAVVGPNNSGKSAAIRLLHELQPVWNVLLGADAVKLTGQRFDLGNLRDVPDSLDVFFDGNSRDIEILVSLHETEDAPAAGGQVHALRVRWERVSRHAFAEVRLADGSVLEAPKSVNQNEGWITNKRDEKVDARWLFVLLRALLRAQYIPPQRYVAVSGGAEPFGISIGANFVQRWSAFKLGQSKAQTIAALETEALIASIFGFDKLQINATPSNDLQIVIDGRPYRISEVGHGISQFVVTLVNLLFLKPPIVLIDEPEAGLHPALQLKYLSHVQKTTQGKLLFATHSIGLARSLTDDIIALRRDGGRSVSRPFHAVRNYAEFVGELSFSTWREMGARGVLLVEGVSDVRAVTALLRMLGKDLEIVVLPMGGRELIKAGTGKEIDDLRRLHTDVHVLIDSERGTPSAPLANLRQQFADECSSLGLDIHVLERRAIENYWPEAAIRRATDESATSLAPFQDVRGSGCGWGKADNWRIASAMQEGDLEGTDLLAFLRRL